MQHGRVRTGGVRGTDIGDRSRDPDRAARAFFDAQQQRCHVERGALRVGQLGSWGNWDIVGHDIGRPASGVFAFRGHEDGIKPADHATRARPGQIELPPRFSIEEGGDAITVLPPEAQEHIVVAIEGMHSVASLGMIFAEDARVYAILAAFQ